MVAIKIKKISVLCLVLLASAVWWLSYRKVLTQGKVRSDHEPGSGSRGRTPKVYKLQTDNPLPEWEDASTTERLVERSKHVADTCKHWRKEYDSWAHELFCDESNVKEHLVYARNISAVSCLLENNGADFWRRILHILSGSTKTKNPYLLESNEELRHSLPTLSGYSFYRTYEILHSSTKFMFVRHPYSRLLAAYLDNIYLPNPNYWHSVIHKIVHKRVIGNRRTYLNVTFSEFVQYFIEIIEEDRCIDPLFSQSFRSCHPCEIGYDLIGKFETFEYDSLAIIKQIQGSASVSLTGFRSESESLAISELIKTTYENINSSLRYGFTPKHILLRAWRRLQSKGILGKFDVFPVEEIMRNPRKKNFQTIVVSHYLNDDRSNREGNRIETLMEAYSQLSDETIAHLQNIFKLEFKLYRYSPYPSFIKDRMTYSNTKIAYIEMLND